MASTNRLSTKHSDLPVTHAPILIIGGSMVGMTLAALLCHHGVEGIIAAEKHASTAVFPRAALFHPRSTQIYRELGMYESMVEQSRQSYDNHSGIVVLDTLAGKLLSTLMRDMNEGIDGISPTERIFLTQMMFEPSLKAKAVERGAGLWFSTEMLDFEQDDEGVTALLADATTGDNKKLVRSKYMVAADGTRSGVRQALNISTEGHGLLSRSITIYFNADLSWELRTRYTGVIYVNNPELRGFFRLDKVGKEDFLVVFSVGEPGTEKSRFVADYVTDDLANQLLRTALGIDVKYEITHVAKWTAVCDNAARYTKDRVFLAGDSAHTVTPHGGYGGNAGVHDAHNLAWKLAFVLQGRAGPGLLETYNAERNPVGKQTIDQVYHHYVTRTANEFMTDGWDKHIRLVTDHFLELGYRYHSKALHTSSLGDIVEDPATAPVTPGSFAHHVMVQVEESKQQEIPIADLLGKTFILLTGPNGAAWGDATRSLKQDISLPEVVTHRIFNGAFRARYDIGSDGAVLVRPDGFVAWKVHDSPAKTEDQGSLLSRVMKKLLCLEERNKRSPVAAMKSTL